ncbi:hypothetical protein Rs2_04754 [Raphanus sativus]|nr:hypothetical protein Rs2_04754 [Raphanus sativus]
MKRLHSTNGSFGDFVFSVSLSSVFSVPTPTSVSSVLAPTSVSSVRAPPSLSTVQTPSSVFSGETPSSVAILPSVSSVATPPSVSSVASSVTTRPYVFFVATPAPSSPCRLKLALRQNHQNHRTLQTYCSCSFNLD